MTCRKCNSTGILAYDPFDLSKRVDCDRCFGTGNDPSELDVKKDWKIYIERGENNANKSTGNYNIGHSIWKY